jgi:pimeloyl-ACP methyl ester carboxylesterase
MTEYLQNRFNQKKIYLMGHSWGTYLGIKTIEKYPENYIAYIGIGQLSNQLESEKLAYDYMLWHAEEINDKSAVKNLQKYDKNAADFPAFEYMGRVRSVLMDKYGIGVAREKFTTGGLVVNMLFFFRGYTLSDKINFARGMLFSQMRVWDYVITDNLFNSSVVFQVPVYITHGKYDYQVSYALSREYYDKIEAPDKMFYTFENSAHSPIMEEPEKFVQIIREIASKQGQGNR